MRSRRASRQAVRARRERAGRRAPHVVALGFAAVAASATLVLTAFGNERPSPEVAPFLPPSARLVAAGPPRPEIVAVHGQLRLQLPVAQESVTAIGYHAAGNGALPLEPLGRQGNRGFLRRLADRIFGAERGGLVWYALGGRSGPPTSALDVGAAPGTDVFSPVDGTVIGISEFVLNGRRFGSRIDIQPTGAPSLVVSLTRLRRDRTLAIGDAVVAGGSRLGTVLDLSAVEEHALARYTQDAGNHVTIEVRPAATLALPF